MVVGYMREGEECQAEVLMKDYHVEKVFIEKNGMDDRPQLKEMLNFIRDGVDVVVVSNYSQIARTVNELLRCVKFFKERNIRFISIEEQLDTVSVHGQATLCAFAELMKLEHETISQGKQGKKGSGRKCKQFDEKQLTEVMMSIENKTMTIAEAARKLNVSRATMYNRPPRKLFFGFKINDTTN